jgi:hypothetical protein
MPLDPNEIEAIKQHVRDLAHPDNGLQGVLDVVDLWNQNPGLYDAVHQPDPVTGVTIMNPGKDPAAVTEKYLRKVSAAAPDWVAGMMAPKADFKAAAMAAAGKWTNAVQDAISRDAFRTGMGKVDATAAIATAVSDRGQAYTAGVAKRKDKITAAFQRVIPALGAISQQIRQMPQDTPSDRVARMVANLELVRGLKGKI